MNLKKQVVGILLAVVMPVCALAQNVTVKGQVRDDAGEPLMAAAVAEMGTSNGTATDINGNYTITVASNATLQFSFMGYNTVTESVKGRTTINVTLSEDAELLEEVVVVGYGTQRKKLVTTSTVNITADRIAATNSIDAIGALQSQAAGINITSNSGQPGESYKITIRGMGTIGNSEPLYVIDGVPGGSITSLSPNDIESIDVLKDAASSAIYGARAANGVILVNTKKGKAGGKSQIVYDGYYGFQNPNTNGVTPLNAKQYMEIINKAYEIQGTTLYDFESLIPTQYALIQNGTWNGTNWLEEATNHDAPIMNHSLSMTGGNDFNRYALGVTYFSQEGTIGYPANPYYDRLTARMNSEYVLWKKEGRDIVTFGENVTFTTTNKAGLAIGNNYNNNVRELLTAAPLMPAYNSDGDFYVLSDMQAENWNYNQDFRNPLAQIQYNHGNKNDKGYRLQSNFFLELRPFIGLTVKSSAGWNYNQTASRRYVPQYELSANNSNPTDDVTQRQSYSSRWSLENTVNYNKSFGLNDIDLLLGQSVEKWGYGESVSAKNSNSLFPGSYDHAYIDNTQGLDVANTEIKGSPNDQGALSSFFARINYNYDEKYLFSALIRADGSSNFMRGHRWGYFPSVSAGWVLSNEDFMAGTKGAIDFLKLRASWGQNGNCNIDNFQYLATIAFDAPYYFGNKDIPQTGAYPDILPNADVKWETSQQLDLGADFRFLNNRLSLSFD